MTSSPHLHILERDGCPIHFWLQGPQDAPLVVLTHGAGIDHHEWQPQLPVLTPYYRVLTWDVRGHGQSQPLSTPFTIRAVLDDLLALLDMLAMDQAMFVGHSMGGNIHQELVFYHPERVRALVMLGCTCNTQALTRFEQSALKWGVAALAYWPFLRRQSAWISATTQRGREYIMRAMRQIPIRDFAAIMAATATCLHNEPGYTITAPLLIAVGDLDRTGNIRKVAQPWAERDHAPLAVIPGAGHAANLDRPEEFNRILLDFLQQQVPIGGGTPG